MRRKWQLIASVFQLTDGLAAILAAIIALIGGENMSKWIVTVLLSAAYVVLGIIGIMDYKSNK